MVPFGSLSPPWCFSRLMNKHTNEMLKDNNLVVRTRVHACLLSFSCIQLFATIWTLAHQASLSVRFSREEYWSGLPCPPPGNLPYPGTESASLISPALTGKFLTTSATWEAPRTRVVPRYSGIPPMVLYFHQRTPVRRHSANFLKDTRQFLHFTSSSFLVPSLYFFFQKQIFLNLSFS